MSAVLAGMLSRDSFFQQLDAWIAAPAADQPMAGILVLNIHRFRDINTSFGYRAGDQLLEALTMRLRHILRDSDVVARMSGDEFALMFPAIGGVGHPVLIANKILQALEQPFTLDGRRVKMKVSMGIALHPEHGVDAAALLRHADLALAHARVAGRPYAVYSDEQARQDMAPLVLENELQATIEGGGLELYYQPKINLRSGLACGAEALARWRHPERGFVSPDTFIPIAEQTGLIVPLTLWSLNTALRQCATCRRRWDRLSIAVNLSASILHDPDVVDLVTRAMRISNTDPGQLTLEITESAMMVDPVRSLDTLQRLHDLGVVIAIDDFGTGYSSLAYLKKLPLRELKIDKSFVINMAEDEDDRRIVRSIIDLAHNFGLNVVAEGVENQETLDMLADWGCDYAQGFHMGRPMCSDDVKRWMAESRWGLGEPCTAEADLAGCPLPWPAI